MHSGVAKDEREVVLCHNITVGLLLLRNGARVAAVVSAKKQTEIYTQGELSLLVTEKTLCTRIKVTIR